MTAASNSEARKRARAARAPECTEPCCDACGGSGTDQSGPCSECYATGHTHPQATQTPASQPIPAPVDSGAIGRLNEAERAALRLQVRQALVTSWRDEYSVATVVAGITECLEDYLADLVREHTERALAEVERTLEAVRGLLEPHRSVDAISGCACEVAPVHIRAKDLRAILDRSES